MKFFNNSKFTKFFSIFFFIILISTSTFTPTVRASSNTIPRTSFITSIGNSISSFSSNLADGWSAFINGILDLPILRQTQNTPAQTPPTSTPPASTPPYRSGTPFASEVQNAQGLAPGSLPQAHPLAGEEKTPPTTTIIQQISKAGLTGNTGQRGIQGEQGPRGLTGPQGSSVDSSSFVSKSFFDNQVSRIYDSTSDSIKNSSEHITLNGTLNDTTLNNPTINNGTFSGVSISSVSITGSIGTTTERLIKGWFDDIESTNMPTVGGTSLASIFAPIFSPTFTGTVSGITKTMVGLSDVPNLSFSGSNTGDQTLVGLGGVPTTRSLTINGTALDLSADRTWTISTIAGLAGSATNIAGGAGGSIPYQTSADNTGMLANGSVGQVLTSGGTTVAPSWTTLAGMIYPGTGIPNSTGSAWDTSYTTSGSGAQLALTNSPVFTTPTLGSATATSINNLPLSQNNTDFNVKVGQDAGLNLFTGAQYNTFLGYEAGKSGAGTSTNAADGNTGIGYQSLYSNTTGYGNTANGSQSLRYNTGGSSNTANGTFSLFSNTTGASNTANGSYSLRYNTNGSYNTANGYNSLYSNATGSFNTANGTGSLYFNATGSSNTANGNNSLGSNTSGSYNTANGLESLYSNTTGTSNTANGYQSLYSNSANNKNTAMGYNSMQYADDRIVGRDTFNTAIGYEALRGSTTAVNNTGRYNTAIGNSALWSNTSGNFNTANGSQSLYSNTSGSWNTANGYASLLSNTIGNYNTANGYYSLYSNISGNYNTANGHNSLYSNTGSYNTAIGFSALYSNTTGLFNTANGHSSLSSNKANNRSTAMGYNSMQYADDRIVGRDTFNTAIGYEALKGSATAANNTGQYNTAIGDSALFSNTSGSSNTANGIQSLYFNTTGNNNTANGTLSLYSNTGGNQNTANGTSSLYSNTTGDYNTANGFQSLYSNIGGTNNTANGTGSLRSNTDGSYNTANGYYSLYTNKANNRSTAIGYNSMYYADNRTTGQNTFNTAIGYESLKGSSTPASNTGRYNTAIGDSALFSITSGSFNTATGFSSLYSNTEGDQNTANGYYSLYSNITGYQNTANGYQSLRSNTTGHNNTANGINSLLSNTTGHNNTANGYNSLYSNTDGQYNVGLGYGAGQAISGGVTVNTTGDYNIFIGSSTKALADNDQNEIVIGYDATGNGTNSVTLGSTAITKTILQGQVGIGIAIPTNTLHVSGAPVTGTHVARIVNTLAGVSQNNGLLISAGNDTGVATSEMITFTSPNNTIIGSITQTAVAAVAYNSGSDRRIKENITPTVYGLTDLLKIEVSDFTFISDANHQKTTGFIAQDLNNIFPVAVTTNGDNGTDNLAQGKTPWMIDYGRITPLIVQSIKDMNLKVEELNNMEVENDWRDSIMAWLANSANHITRIFTGEVCLTEGGGQESVCLNAGELRELKTLLSGSSNQNTSGGNNSIPTKANTSTAGDTVPPEVIVGGDQGVTSLAPSGTENINNPVIQNENVAPVVNEEPAVTPEVSPTE